MSLDNNTPQNDNVHDVTPRTHSEGSVESNGSNRSVVSSIKSKFMKWLGIESNKSQKTTIARPTSNYSNTHGGESTKRKQEASKKKEDEQKALRKQQEALKKKEDEQKALRKQQQDELLAEFPELLRREKKISDVPAVARSGFRGSHSHMVPADMGSPFRIAQPTC
ncbi:unnamed protein product [Ambrosiozyma monospora]|uniref:Unnamed protein product n=1 Tax=Ambrosiozyma monospora TaxID=43982 RepID=A0A9W7DMU5_AMBMO|nr:unnamed protein product [Ambrosiozyma monospora]